MCISPQRRAIFRHLNFKKWSEHAVFCTLFDFQMCFSPQRRAIFRQLNRCAFRQKWSRIVSFLTFSLPNVLFATAACNFWTSELQKVVPDPQFFNIFTSECAFRRSGVRFLMSPLSTYLRTRRFNRPAFWTDPTHESMKKHSISWLL